MTAKNIAKTIWLSISAVRLIPHILLIACHPSKRIILLDMERWSIEKFNKKPETTSGTIWTFIKLMTFSTEYRTLIYYRLGWISIILHPLCKPMPLLDISKVDDGIGPGFLIVHGRASSVGAKKIGKNFKILQHVTIGYINETDKPIIGDNVTVFAGAKILGKVILGDNVLVGANAVVVKNVPDNCTVVGVPAYIVRRNGVKVKEPL
jgi:serine O-acetyltransferase